MDPAIEDGRGLRWFRRLGAIVALALVYWVSAILGRLLANYGVVTAVWPPAGLAVAALTIGGWRLWPGVALGVGLTVAVDVPAAQLPIRLPPGAVLLMCAGNTLEALVGAAVLRRALGPRHCVDTVRKALSLLGVPFLASSVSATVGNLALVYAGGTTWGTFPDTWWTWWVGNALGIFVVTPCLLALAAPWARPPRRRWPVELLALLLFGGLTAAYAMFGAFPDAPRATREAWLLYPCLVWAALRFGPQGAGLSVFVAGTLALASTAFRLGPAGDPTMPDVVLRVQVFVGVMSTSILLIAAFVAERWAAYETLARLNAGLEEEVARRTVELRTTNEQLLVRNLELAAINAELDRFAASVSHDLRAPVTAVAGFSEILRDRHGASLDADGVALLERILRAARRMSVLIDRLLQLSRAGRSALDVQAVDVARLVHAVSAEVGIPDEHLEIGPLPSCRADPALLGTVFANLLQNARKFTRDVPTPRVEVGGERVPGGVRYWVRDNGVGFDGQQAGQIFRAFTRLHAGYEGSGIGLAIVRRIVEVHGGRVSAEAEVGRGAIFRIELPDAS